MSEQELAMQRDTLDEERMPRPVTVVGVGASAGGLSALKGFLARFPEESGLAFVVVVHLSPQHESHLADILQPHARMPVQQVNETTRLEANNVYVIPPNANISAVDTHLRLSELEPRGRERAQYRPLLPHARAHP
jgi:two-component system, chemotaxis family, CheB/CheR fusion protein